MIPKWGAHFVLWLFHQVILSCFWSCTWGQGNWRVAFVFGPGQPQCCWVCFGVQNAHHRQQVKWANTQGGILPRSKSILICMLRWATIPGFAHWSLSIHFDQLLWNRKLAEKTIPVVSPTESIQISQAKFMAMECEWYKKSGLHFYYSDAQHRFLQSPSHQSPYSS